MRMSAATTPLVLLVLAAGASGYAYFVDRGAISDADRELRRGDVFPSFRIEDVDRVELARASETVALARDRARKSWTLEIEPAEVADSGAVDALLREFELARRVRDVPDGEAAGLEAPRVRGRIVLARGSYTFALGAEAPRPEGAAYMRVDGEGTFVVGRALAVQLLRPASAYRERALVPYGPSQVARLDLRGPAGHVAIERAGTAFRVGGPAGSRAARAEVDRLFAALADARADNFLDHAPAAADDAAPVAITLTPRTSDDPPVRLTLAGPCPGAPDDVVAVRSEPSPRAACVPRSVRDRLDVRNGALVDSHIIYAHADEIEEIRLEDIGAPSRRIELVRRGAGWRERAPEPHDLTADENDSADALAGDLARSEAADVVAAAADPFTPRVRATVVRTGSSATEVIEVGPPDDSGLRRARRLDDGAWIEMTRDTARRFEPHPIALHGRALAGFGGDTAAVTAIEDTCSVPPQRLEMRDAGWALRAPAGFDADAVSATDLADAFTHARADAWITEADDGTFGLGSPGGCTVKLWLREPYGGAARQIGIIFGGAHEGGEYARTLDSSAVFIAPAALRAIAKHPAIDRSRLRLDPDAVARLVIRRGVERRAFRSAGGRFVRADDVAWVGAVTREDPSDGGGDRLGSAIAGFYAHDALHAGPAAASEGFERATLVIDAVGDADAGGRSRRITVGAPRPAAPFEAYFARVSDVDATFAVPRRAVDAILAAW